MRPAATCHTPRNAGRQTHCNLSLYLQPKRLGVGLLQLLHYRCLEARGRQVESLLPTGHFTCHQTRLAPAAGRRSECAHLGGERKRGGAAGWPPWAELSWRLLRQG